jgi:hypothetical protein
MTHGRRKLLLGALRDERGQVIPFMVLLSVLFFGMAGLSIDLGRAYASYRELQASTDAAALAGGYAMGQANATETTTDCAVYEFSSAVTATADCGGSTVSGYNVNPNLPSATVTAVNFSCVSNSYTTGVYCTAGVPCSASASGCNVLQVVQTAAIPTFFIQALHYFHVNTADSLTLAATSTALMRGSVSSQYNVAVILDSTGSMGQADTDGNCTAGTTKEVCALSGIQTLLAGLTPCGPGSNSSTCASAFDSVAVFTFPNVKESTASDATTCSGTKPSGMPYSVMVPGTTWSAPTSSEPDYEITSGGPNSNGFEDDYSSTNAYGGSIVTTTANQLEIATGADTGHNCTGLTTPISGQGTYLAGAIYAAQSALVAAQKNAPGSLNAIILLTDGDANATNTFTTTAGVTLSSTTTPKLNTTAPYLYPSMKDQCAQAITAAQYAATNGTSVYVVAYQSPTSGCDTDTTDTDPCANLKEMALQAGSTAAYAGNFYSDATTTNHGACTSTANPNLTLNQVFTQVATSFTTARLLPN